MRKFRLNEYNFFIWNNDDLYFETSICSIIKKPENQNLNQNHNQKNTFRSNENKYIIVSG